MNWLLLTADSGIILLLIAVIFMVKNIRNVQKIIWKIDIFLLAKQAEAQLIDGLHHIIKSYESSGISSQSEKPKVH